LITENTYGLPQNPSVLAQDGMRLSDKVILSGIGHIMVQTSAVIVTEFFITSTHKGFSAIHTI
jgi:hypothetical protein